VTRDAGPTPPSERIVALDALRGVALLGILLINVWAFAMPETTLFNPTVYADTTVYGDFTGANYWAWAFSHVFAQNKFITLFSALFGAGNPTVHREQRGEGGQDAVRLHYRRTAILIAIGLMHAYLLWYGDILVAYGVTALVVVAFRNLEARKLAGVGVVFLLFLPVVELFAAITLGGDAIASRRGTGGSRDRTAGRDVPRRLARTARPPGPILVQPTDDRLHQRAILAGRWHHAPRDGAVPLGRVDRRAVVGPVPPARCARCCRPRDHRRRRRLHRGQRLERRRRAVLAAVHLRRQLPLAGGYLGIVMLYARRRPDGPVTRGLAAVGRTAFTNYLLQTVIATTVFYGHGLGLFGSVTRVEQLGFVLVVWVVQIVLSVLWLRSFRFGPVEWIWRTLTYGETQPIRNPE